VRRGRQRHAKARATRLVLDRRGASSVPLGQLANHGEPDATACALGRALRVQANVAIEDAIAIRRGDTGPFIVDD
jgi:hypothetical protein